MSRRRGSACVALLLALASSVGAQDSTAKFRHLLPLDLSRVESFTRSYDMDVITRDSFVVIGQRDLSLTAASYAGSPAWLLVETRSGVVPSVDSLYLAPDLRPIHWSSTLGAARLGLEFVGDSILGAMTAPTGRRNLLLESKPDVIVSSAMAEVLVPLLPLERGWSDSVNVLSIDLASASLRTATLSVNDAPLDLSPQGWAVTLKSDSVQTTFWVAGDPRRVVQVRTDLPNHIGRQLVYRERSGIGLAPPPPP